MGTSGENEQTERILGSDHISSTAKVRVFEGKQGSILYTYLAVALWPGAIHLTVVIVLSAFILLPPSKALLAFCLLVVFTVVPIDDKGKLGRKVARFICKHACEYFPLTLLVEDYDAFDPDRSYVFGYEPHSVLPIGAIALTESTGFMPFTKIKFLAGISIFYIPIVRHIWTWLGLSPVSKTNFISLLNSGYSCLVIPGGLKEMFHMEHGCEVVYIRMRQGFVRIAIETGAPLVPVFCFGQSEAYSWLMPRGKLFLHLYRLTKVTPILFWGIFGSALPYRRPIHVVVGRPIEVKKNPLPSTIEVKEVHEKYVDALESLFESHKSRFGYPNLQLKVL